VGDTARTCPGAFFAICKGSKDCEQNEAFAIDNNVAEVYTLLLSIINICDCAPKGSWRQKYSSAMRAAVKMEMVGERQKMLARKMQQDTGNARK
jgi:hypothetical protein